MIDKPDWEKAWERAEPVRAAYASGATHLLALELEAKNRCYGWRDGYLAASAQLEAAVAKAKAEVLREVDETVANQWAGGTGDPPELSDAYDQVIATLLAKYSEPTAVAATEKEG